MSQYFKVFCFISFTAFIYLIRHNNCKIANVKCPEDIWKERNGSRTWEIKFDNTRDMVEAALLAAAVIRFYLEEKGFRRKFKLDGVYSADRMLLDNGTKFYTMEVHLYQTMCLYDRYKPKKNSTISNSSAVNPSKNCEHPVKNWEKTGNRTWEVDFNNTSVMSLAAILAETVILDFLEVKGFYHKMKLDAIYAINREILNTGSEFYTMKVSMHQTTCVYDIYVPVQNGSVPTTTEDVSCENEIPPDHYFNGTCCVQFMHAPTNVSSEESDMIISDFSCEKPQNSTK